MEIPEENGGHYVLYWRYRAGLESIAGWFLVRTLVISQCFDFGLEGSQTTFQCPLSSSRYLQNPKPQIPNVKPNLPAPGPSYSLQGHPHRREDDAFRECKRQAIYIDNAPMLSMGRRSSRCSAIVPAAQRGILEHERTVS